ncbi:MAG TPA: NAD(+) synthase [Cyclobacteriaceae bacterium]|nr:NAD(+) synthase [Cyclobacteriaceae bacterium]
MKLKIAGASLNQTPLDWEGNTTRVLRAIQEARNNDADIVCFQELCITGYGCEDLHLAPWLSEKAWEELEKIVEHTSGLVVCIGLPIHFSDKTWNGACVIHDQKILGITLKQNLALDGVHYEPRWFEPWPPNEVTHIHRNGKDISVGDLVYDVKGIRFGFEICEDAWRRIRPGEILCQRGVDLIINPSASHFALGKSHSRETLVLDSSKKFNCAYVYVNVLGNEAGRMIYDGDIIFAQKGQMLGVHRRLSFKPFQLQTCTIDFDDPSKSERLPKTDITDRSEEFAQAVSLALYDYLRKSKAKGFVLSLSGGADSSCCAVLVAEMVRRAAKEVGYDKTVGDILTCAYQGTKNSSETTLEAARELAHSIGAGFHQWNIDDEVNSYTAKAEKAIGRKLQWETDDVSMQNIQARARSPIIWMLANIKQSILLTTSNRSEGDVGYATMDGDTSGSLAPIAGIDKPFIMMWLKWAEKELGYKGLGYVNNLQPTAELRPLERAQTDEKDLMPYPVLVDIEKLAFLYRKPPVEVYKLLSEKYDPVLLKDYVRKFFRLWAANQWKRERLAPSFHLDDLNVDPRSWLRFPILSGGFKHELEELG